MDIREIKLFTSAECEEYAYRVRGLRPFWFDRDWGYTLGAATYQDSPTIYPALSNYTNIVLRQRFDDMYSKVSHVLTSVLDREITTLANTALPAFHIFTPRVNTGQHGHPHVDTPYDRIYWPDAISEPFSFTLPIQLPKCGGGLGFWDNVTAEQLDDYAQTDEIPEPTVFDYELGSLYLHDGMTPHRIENFGTIHEGELRVTLQGHGVTLNTTGQVVVYF